MQKRRSRRALIHAQEQRVTLAAHGAPDEQLAWQVAARLKPRQIVDRDGTVLVTEVGFVTMAIHSDFVTDVNGLLAVPGVDDSGQRGFLVLFNGTAPFHALADDVQSACELAVQSQNNARLLAETYGNKAAMYRAARQAPWFMIAKEEDLVTSGMCDWGVDSWLRRCGLTRFKHLGLPSIVLRLAGFYGARVTASALLRINGVSSVRRQVDSESAGHVS